MIPFNIFGVKNFRVFGDEYGFLEEFSNINLITGANNSGKSSVIKALQLIKNSTENNLFPFDLDFTKQEHLLGDINNVLNNKENDKIVISLPFFFMGISSVYISFTFIIPSENNIYYANMRKIEIIDKFNDTVLFSFNYREATNDEKQLDEKKYVEKKSIYKLEYEKFLKENKNSKNNNESIYNDFFSEFDFPPQEPFENPLQSYIDWEINVELLEKYFKKLIEMYKIIFEKKLDYSDLLKYDKNHYKIGLFPSLFYNSFRNKLDIIKWEEFLNKISLKDKIIFGSKKISDNDFQADEPYFSDFSIGYIFYNKILGIIKDEFDWKENDKEYNYSVIENAFKNQIKYLIGRLKSINYLSNIREDNARIFNTSNNTSFINLLKKYYLLNEPNKNFLIKYLQLFEIGKALKIECDHKYQLISVVITTLDDKNRDLVDFGYGIKQVIVILIQICVLAKEYRREIECYDYLEVYFDSNLLLIEEPEANLHPKWQSLLANIFVEANEKYNIQFIIETHSEYLIRRFQTLVSQDKIKGEKIKIIYFRNPLNISQGKKQIETLNIQPDGYINYQVFDNGFFDESYNLELSLLNIQRDRFFKEFNELKNNNEFNQNKIVDLERKIDDFVSKLDYNVYKKIIELNFDISKLNYRSVEYLSSGQFLLNTIDEISDFSPVIIQYGRVVENELNILFENIYNGEYTNNTNTFGYFQAALELFKHKETNLKILIDDKVSKLLKKKLYERFNNPMSLKIEQLHKIRKERNNASHSGKIKTKQKAIDYINLVNDFLISMISLKK